MIESSFQVGRFTFHDLHLQGSIVQCIYERLLTDMVAAWHPQMDTQKRLTCSVEVLEHLVGAVQGGAGCDGGPNRCCDRCGQHSPIRCWRISHTRIRDSCERVKLRRILQLAPDSWHCAIGACTPLTYGTCAGSATAGTGFLTLNVALASTDPGMEPTRDPEGSATWPFPATCSKCASAPAASSGGGLLCRASASGSIRSPDPVTDPSSCGSPTASTLVEVSPSAIGTCKSTCSSGSVLPQNNRVRKSVLVLESVFCTLIALQIVSERTPL